MRTPSFFTFSPRKSAIFVAAFALSATLLAFSVVSAQAAPVNPDKVSICHRTHSTTNPYRMITISKSAVDGPLNPRSSGNSSSAAGDHAGILHNKHNNGGSALVEWDANFPTYNTKSGNAGAPVVLSDNPVRVFDPQFTYASNQKMWEDIIPPFTLNGVEFSGLNWSEKGKAIYYGQTLNGVNYSGICKKMGSLEYYNSEIASGESANDVLDDIKDQRNIEQDGSFSGRPALNQLTSDPPSNKGPSKPSRLNTLVNTLATTNSSKSPSQMTQAIAGVVWFDDDSDGIQDLAETSASSVGIVLKDPSGNLYTVGYKKSGKPTVKFASLSGSSKRIFAFANATENSGSIQLATTVLTVSTDANGYFEFPSVPEGEWQVIVVTPTGYTYTYDSAGSSDGIMPGTLVPAGGVGFAWAGLVLTSSSSPSSSSSSSPSSSSSSSPSSNSVSGSGSGSSNNSVAGISASSLPNTGTSGTLLVAGGIGFIMLIVGVVVTWIRNKKS